MIDYNSKTVSELRGMAKESGITGYSKMRKAELITALGGNVVVISQGNRKNDPETFGEPESMKGRMVHVKVPLTPSIQDFGITQVDPVEICTPHSRKFVIIEDKENEETVEKMASLSRPTNRHQRRMFEKQGVRRKSKPLIRRKAVA